VLTVQSVERGMPKETNFEQPLYADIGGFSLHAAMRCGADGRQALEQLCRSITRPELANERVQANAARQVVLKLNPALARRHHASGDVAAGVHAALGSAGAQARWWYRKSPSHRRRPQSPSSARRTVRTTDRRG